MTRSLANQIAREASGNAVQIIVPPVWVVESVRLLLLGLFIAASTWAALWAVCWLDYGWSRFNAGVKYCAAGPVAIEMHGACKKSSCLEARAQLIYDASEESVMYAEWCLKKP